MPPTDNQKKAIRAATVGVGVALAIGGGAGVLLLGTAFATGLIPWPQRGPKRPPLPEFVWSRCFDALGRVGGWEGIVEHVVAGVSHLLRHAHVVLTRSIVSPSCSLA